MQNTGSPLKTIVGVPTTKKPTYVTCYCGVKHRSQATINHCLNKLFGIIPTFDVICKDTLEHLGDLVTIHYLIKETNQFVYFNDHVFQDHEDDQWIKGEVVSFLEQKNWFHAVNSRQILEIIKKYRLSLVNEMKSKNEFNGFLSKVSGVKILHFSLLNGVLEYNWETRQKKLLKKGLEKFMFREQLNIIYPENDTKKLKIPLVSAIVPQIIPDKRDQILFMTYLAYTLLEGDYDWETILMLLGYGKNGKSTLLDTWGKIFPKTRPCNLNDLDKEFGKSLIWEANFIRGKVESKKDVNADISILNAIASGEDQEINVKYLRQIAGKIKGKMGITANFLLKAENTAAYRRLLAIRTPITIKNPDPSIKKRLEKELVGWFVTVLDCIGYYYENVGDLINESEERTRRLFEDLQTPFNTFADNVIKFKKGGNTLTKDIHRAYETWRKVLHHEPLNINSIGMRIGRIFRMKSTRITSNNNGFEDLAIDDVYMKTIDPNWKASKPKSKIKKSKLGPWDQP